MASGKYYADLNRKYKKVLTDWNACLKVQRELGGVNFKKFGTEAEAQAYLRESTDGFGKSGTQMKFECRNSSGTVFGETETVRKDIDSGEKKDTEVNGARLCLFQGMARYKDSRPKADQSAGYVLKTIEKYKLDRIPQFTLAIPGQDDRIGLCVRTGEPLGEKIAEISDRSGKIVLQFSKKTSELEVRKEPLGYLMICLYGYQLSYSFSVRQVPDFMDFDGPAVFVDGSGGGGGEVEYDGQIYQTYGGAYLFFREGESIPYESSRKEEHPIAAGLKGISPKVGNVYGEINGAISAIKRADEMGVQRLRLYYDCEQIGGNAPGGVYLKAGARITAKYRQFWEQTKFRNLKEIELIHVDAHSRYECNERIDELAKETRDSVMDEFEQDEQKRQEYIRHRNDYSA